MSDAYQPIYDAVRSRISNGDIGEAALQAFREANLSHYAQMAAIAAVDAANAQTAPSVLFRPKIFQDGDKWCALYGDDLQQGVAGFGESPAQAMYMFDVAWHQKLGGSK